MDTFELTRHEENKVGQSTGEQYLEAFERRLATALRRILVEANRNKEVKVKKKELDGPGN